jgi:hypothetical protein
VDDWSWWPVAIWVMAPGTPLRPIATTARGTEVAVNAATKHAPTAV